MLQLCNYFHTTFHAAKNSRVISALPGLPVSKRHASTWEAYCAGVRDDVWKETTFVFSFRVWVSRFCCNSSSALYVWEWKQSNVATVTSSAVQVRVACVNARQILWAIRCTEVLKLLVLGSDIFTLFWRSLVNENWYMICSWQYVNRFYKSKFVYVGKWSTEYVKYEYHKHV
jgi:hypothetical protein